MPMHAKNIYKPKLVDWRAVIWAGLIAGTVTLLFEGFIVPFFIGGNIWVMLRLLASLILGEGILAPPATFDLMALTCGMIIQIILSLSLTSILAIITHRWGLITGILIGAAFGICVYLITVYALTFIYPWLMVAKHPAFLGAYILFGIVAGGVYELLEYDEAEYQDGKKVRERL